MRRKKEEEEEEEEKNKPSKQTGTLILFILKFYSMRTVVMSCAERTHKPFIIHKMYWYLHVPS